MSSKLQLSIVVLFVLMLSAVGCHRLECASDEDCPDHWSCVGSSLCPPDAVCIWAGEPGLCLPAVEEHLCAHTGGEWDENSCGHYECGEFPACDAVIPGCNCGPDSTFVDGRGCVEDIACTGGCYTDEDCEGDLVCHGARLHPEHPTHPRMGELSSCMWGHDQPGECVEPEAALCEESGGRWDETSCGDYQCGQPPVCAAVIPGCDCGPMANYVEDEGCVKDRECPGVCDANEDCDEGEVCQRSKRSHDAHEIADLLSSMDASMEEEALGMCIDADIPLCRRTGGTWDETRCGHSSCRSDITCLAIIPGCDCGERASWVEGEGCVRDPECAPIVCNGDRPCPAGMTCERISTIAVRDLGDPNSLTLEASRDYGVCKPL